MDDVNAFAKKKPLPIPEQDLDEEVDPLDKVRIYLQNQNTLGSIQEATTKPKNPKNKAQTKENDSNLSSYSKQLTEYSLKSGVNQIEQEHIPSGFKR